MKSISPLIATILLIVIVVAMSGLLYMFLTGTFNGLLSSSSSQISKQSQYVSFNIVNTYCSNNILYFIVYNAGNIPININNAIINIQEGNNYITVNGSNIICNNNPITSGSQSICYINNSVCGYNPNLDINPQINIIYQGVSNSKSLGVGYGVVINPEVITIYNTQNISTPAPFQQDIAICDGNLNVGNNFAYANYPALIAVVDNNGQNVYFFTNLSNSTGSLLYSWYEGQDNINGTLCDVWWVNISNGIPANSSITIYMYVGSQSANYYQQYYPYVGASYNVLGTFQYDNIGYVMNAGLIYQIYYDNNNWYEPPLQDVYQALLNNGYSFSANGQTWTASTNYFTTPMEGSTQNVNGNTEPYVINNLQYGYSGGNSFPNPPVSNGGNSYAIKEIGFIQVNQSTTFYIWIDDGGVIGISSSTCGFTNWLCNSADTNPGNLINEWTGCCKEWSGIAGPGDYAIEYDWFNGGGPAYWSLWSNNLVYYYSPAYPPNGVMPEISIS